MFLSKYSYVFQLDDLRNVIFQSYSKKSIVIKKKYFSGKSLIIEQIPSDVLSYLLKNYFIFENEDDEKLYFNEIITDHKNELKNELSVIIETTNACNINCLFCYQKGWTQSFRTMSSETLSILLKLIEEFLNKKTIQRINLSIIGGEPLLNQSYIAFYKDLKALCSAINISLRTKINTNGLLLNPSIVSMFEYLDLIIPLNSRNEYGRSIFPKNNQTNIYDTVLSNIRSCSSLLNENRKIVLRYNTNKENISDFEDYLKDVSELKSSCIYVIPEYIFNVKDNIYKNTLDKSEFNLWAQTDAVILLKKYNLPLPYKMMPGINYCKGICEYTFKVYGDGRFSLCNGDEFSTDFSFLSSINSIDEISSIFRNIKNYSSKCIDCRKFFVCPNKAPCRKTLNCDADKYEMEKYLITLINLKSK